MPSLFLCASFLSGPLFADTVILKNGKELKGLVVEQHQDRIVLSTEGGEVVIPNSGIRRIAYDDAEKNFLQIGRAYELKGKLGEALAYYEKALEVNPDFKEAREAAVGVRSRFWATVTEGPQSEIERQQLLHDSWSQQRPLEELIQAKKVRQSDQLKQGLGLALQKKGDWVMLASVDGRKPAALVGLRRSDRLVSVDGESLRYMNVETVTRKFLEPRFSSFTLEVERDFFVVGSGHEKSPQDYGLKLRLEYEGLMVASVKAGSLADEAGIKASDAVILVQGRPTRYMPLGEVKKLFKEADGQKLSITLRRPVLLSRP